MRDFLRCWLAWAMVAGGLTVPVCGADLTKIDRTIRKLPTWQTDAQKYALLVFGPEAQSRVWLVLDGATLYVDRNGNGDLTEPDERFPGKKSGKDGLLFEVPNLMEGDRTHRALVVGIMGPASLREMSDDAREISEDAGDIPGLAELLRRDPDPKGYFISLQVATPGFQGDGEDGRVSQYASFDRTGLLQFANRPEDAPVLHFRGPWTITLGRPDRLELGRPRDVVLRLTTPGLGAGASVSTCYEQLVPESAHPVLDVTFPASAPDAKPVSVRYTLKERC